MTAGTSDVISGNLEETVSWFHEELGQNDDLVCRRFQVMGRYPAALFYFFSLIDQQLLNEDILRPLMQQPSEDLKRTLETKTLKRLLSEDVLHFGSLKFEQQKDKLVSFAMRGDTIVFVDGMDEAMVFSCRKVEKRNTDQPKTESVIRGPREGFIELLENNLSLLRYRLQSRNFRIKLLEIGQRTKTRVAVCFIEDIANPELVSDVMNRLSRVKIDGIISSGYLEEYIEDNHWSPFPQVQYSERPDKVVASMLEGRVAILADGSPMALIVPAVFSQFYQTVEDYSERYLLVSAIRISRLLALLFSLIFPSLYVAIISFNPELIPTDFAVAVAGGRAGVPFPAVIEILIMEVSMEVLREASIRLPVQIGGALSIVGAIIIGQAAVSAGFASPITVVIVALATIGSFATPAYNAALALRLLRFPIIILAGTFGLFGIVVGLIFIVNHMLSLRSFGVPYLSPFVPPSSGAVRDMILRAPMFMMKKRPESWHPQDDTRTPSAGGKGQAGEGAGWPTGGGAGGEGKGS